MITRARRRPRRSSARGPAKSSRGMQSITGIKSPKSLRDFRGRSDLAGPVPAMLRIARGKAGWVFILSSPSGGGKTSAVSRLRRRRHGLMRSVSVTTRAPRRGERHGREYRFVSPAVFARMRRGGQLLEWAKVHGASYGTPKAPVVRAVARGRDVVLSIDVQGARQVRRLLGTRAVLIFLLPETLQDLRRRLVRRRTESSSGLRRRLQAARRELACARWYDYTVVNDRLDDAVDQLEAIVTAQGCRVLGPIGSRRRG